MIPIQFSERPTVLGYRPMPTLRPVYRASYESLELRRYVILCCRKGAAEVIGCVEVGDSRLPASIFVLNAQSGEETRVFQQELVRDVIGPAASLKADAFLPIVEAAVELAGK